jgi:hypothetical protein
MAPKKKGSKKQEQDWEADLGEAAPATDAPAEQPQEEGNEEEAPVGGLMAALRKNKAKKAKKGKVNDFVEGEDAEVADPLANKQPEEGNFDEDDVFAGKAAKPIKEVKQVAKPAAEEPEGEFRVKTKKEKEREKKEKEKQRKKEQVSFDFLFPSFRESVLGVKIISLTWPSFCFHRLPKRKSSHLLKRRPKPRRLPPLRPRRMSSTPLHPPQRPVRRRSFLPIWQLFRSNRRLSGSSVRRKSELERKRGLPQLGRSSSMTRKRRSAQRLVSARRRRSVKRRSSCAKKASCLQRLSERPRSATNCACSR